MSASVGGFNRSMQHCFCLGASKCCVRATQRLQRPHHPQDLTLNTCACPGMGDRIAGMTARSAFHPHRLQRCIAVTQLVETCERSRWILARHPIASSIGRGARIFDHSLAEE